VVFGDVLAFRTAGSTFCLVNGNRRNMKKGMILCAAGLLCLSAVYGQEDEGATTTTTVTGVTGTITQLNYGEDGAIEGFLIGSNTLLTFRNNVSGGIGTLGAVGNSVTYSGTAKTTTAGFSSVRVTTYTNNTTKVTYSSSTTPSTPTAYGPTSGIVTQLNYSDDGSIDSFVFRPSGSTTSLLVVTGPGASATLKPILLPGTAVSVTGTEQGAAPTSPCVASGVLTVVEASSLIINGQTIVITNGDHGLGDGRGHKDGRGHH
jgi:hypothetical protein